MMEGEWSCEACTSFNANTEIACTVCFTTRMSAKDVAVTWEWQAEDVWIPYDLPTCLQVEEAYKQKLDRVVLSSGFFASQRGAYEIQFQWEGRAAPQPRKLFSKSKPADDGKADANAKCLRMTQINVRSHNPRAVRRIDTNDDSIFVKIDKFAVLTDTDKCGVCQDMFIEEEDEDGPCPMPITPMATSQPAAAPTTTTTATPNDKIKRHNSYNSSSNNNTPPPMQTRAKSASNAASSSSSAAVPTPTRSDSKQAPPSLSKKTSSTASSSPAKVSFPAPVTTPQKPPPKMCEQDVVHLAKCRNHYFHRDCISQWVKLKHTCPFCKTPI